MNILDTLPVVSTVRRNHGIEHATIHILTAQFRPAALVGHATLDGFNLYGEVATEQVEWAAGEALRRLRSGDSHLVIHPNCGTNFATAGMAAGIAAWIAGMGGGKMSGKLPRIMVASTLALMLAMPLGFSVQEHITTSPHVGGAQVLGVAREKRGGLTRHQVRIG